MDSRVPQPPLPIIDMHLHALRADSQGPPPLGFCLPLVDFPVAEPGQSWGETFMDWLQHPPGDHPIWSSMTDEELMQQTLAIMERRNVFAVTSGSEVSIWKAAAPDRIIPGMLFPGMQFAFGEGMPTVDAVRAGFESGQFAVFGEVAIQYDGVEPGDPRFDPYLAVAEELDVPVCIHIGTGPPGAPYLGSERYRARLHSPLILEEALIRHPKLRLYIAHAGWPMLDDLLAVLYTHPQVYLDVSAICFVLPRKAFHHYLEHIVESGFGKRVMFGSDQMNWPDALEIGIDAIETAAFLTENQKRDIFYNNAARFLRFSSEQIAMHYGQ
jgi:hypothetical protein